MPGASLDARAAAVTSTADHPLPSCSHWGEGGHKTVSEWKQTVATQKLRGRSQAEERGSTEARHVDAGAKPSMEQLWREGAMAYDTRAPHAWDAATWLPCRERGRRLGSWDSLQLRSCGRLTCPGTWEGCPGFRHLLQRSTISASD